MSGWILQGNPKTFDVDRYLRSRLHIRWTVKPYRQIAVGDRVFIWRADGGKSGTGGVVAVGRATSEPEPGADDAPALWQERVEYAVDDSTLRVKVALEDVRLTPGDGMILRTELEAHPVLNNLQILGFRALIVSQISPDHERALLSLWNSRRSSPDATGGRMDFRRDATATPDETNKNARHQAPTIESHLHRSRSQSNMLIQEGRWLAGATVSTCAGDDVMQDVRVVAEPEPGTLDLSIDEESDDSPLDVPVDRRRVKTDKQDLPVETLYSWVARGKLNLQPEFQRYFVWDAARASRLIESLLLDIPIPVIYVAQEPTSSYVVVDGQQRLTSIQAFVEGRFPDGREFRLTRLGVLTELNGKTFRDLDDDAKEAIMSATLRLIVILHDSDPAVKFEVFERLNLGSERLNDQELRNCVYRGRYNRLLAELATNPHMLKVMGSNGPHPRMLDRQLILRFFAMWRNTHLKFSGNMKQFMNREMEQHRDLDEAELAKMRVIFARSIELAYLVFGVRSFRKFRIGTVEHPDGEWETRKFNVALWDTVLYGLSYYEKAQIVPIADAVREELLDLMSNDPRFGEYLASSTDSVERLRYRADAWLGRLNALVNPSDQGPRSFSLELKQRLFTASPSCAICGQYIHDVDDAEVDHIVHYWKGGKTIPENARLTHRYCNRARSGRN